MPFTLFQNEKTSFQAIKTRNSKSRKIDIFPKGFTHGFGPKMPIFQLFWGHYKPGKCLLRYSRTKKRPFQAIKTKSLKSRKKAIFRKGLTHGFVPKMDIFPTFVFRQFVATENVFYDILERKYAFPGYKNNNFEKSKN